MIYIYSFTVYGLYRYTLHAKRLDHYIVSLRACEVKNFGHYDHFAVHGSMGDAASEGASSSTDFSLGHWNCFVCERPHAKFKARCHSVQGFWGDAFA